MNEELRQVKVVEFCETLTKRIRNAIAVLGPLCPGYGREELHGENNIIRIQAVKKGRDYWKYLFTFDDGMQFDVMHQNITMTRAYVGERFNGIVFEVKEMFHNGDIHFTKHKIDVMPDGLDTSNIEAPFTGLSTYAFRTPGKVYA